MTEGFSTTLQKTHEWLNDVCNELEIQDQQTAYLALRATLHAIRDHLQVDEVAQFGAQLPMLVRGFYYEGWDPPHKRRRRHADDFLAMMDRELRDAPNVNAEDAARASIKVLVKRLPPGEIDQVLAQLPKEISVFWMA